MLFIDLAGFTKVTHGFDPERVRDLADEVLTVVAGIVEEFDGHVDSFRGDGLIAVFGAPRSHPDDPERALQAAAAGLRAIERIGTGRGWNLKGRAGVATGTVIAGYLGSGRVREYTVMGSTVNLAARIEQTATPGQVWACPVTYQEARYRLNLVGSGPVSLAGFPDVSSLFVLAPDSGRVSADPNSDLGFVGRADELAALAHAFDEVTRSGRTSEVWVTGMAGIGKTRFVREFLGSGIEATVLWPEERLGLGFSWFPLARAVFAPQGSDASVPWLSRVHDGLDELLPHEPRWQRYILQSLGLLDEVPWTRLERRRVDRTTLAWRDLLVALANRARGPLVLVIQSATPEATQREFLEMLRLAQAPMLIVRIARTYAGQPGDIHLELPPLNVSDSLELLNQLADPVMRTATEALVYQVGGIPSYILELGRAMSVWGDGSISGSLEGVLQARLDRLSAGQRQLLIVAALSGERSWESLLLSLAEEAGADVLHSLVERDLLVKLPDSLIPSEIEYRFQSELLRQAVLRMVPYSDRPLTHLRIATWLEQNAPLSLSELIGLQFQAGGSDESAFPHLLTALDQVLAAGEKPSDEMVRALEALRLPDALQLKAALARTRADHAAGSATADAQQPDGPAASPTPELQPQPTDHAHPGPPGAPKPPGQDG